MVFRSQFSNVQNSREHNDGVRHPDFNDSVRTSVAEFVEAFANGTPLQRLVRNVEFDSNPSIDDNDFDSITNSPFGKDIIDLNNEIIDYSRYR